MAYHIWTLSASTRMALRHAYARCWDSCDDVRLSTCVAARVHMHVFDRVVMSMPGLCIRAVVCRHVWYGTVCISHFRDHGMWVYPSMQHHFLQKMVAAINCDFGLMVLSEYPGLKLQG